VDEPAIAADKLPPAAASATCRRDLSPLAVTVTACVTARSEEKVNQIKDVTAVTAVTATFGAKRFWCAKS
jgi:hypothetical protein